MQAPPFQLVRQGLGRDRTSAWISRLCCHYAVRRYANRRNSTSLASLLYPNSEHRVDKEIVLAVTIQNILISQ